MTTQTTTTTRIFISALTLGLALAAPASAQTNGGAQAGHDVSATTAPAEAPQTPAEAAFAEYEGAMAKMMDSMHAEISLGDPDADFAAQMIPHHQAAVDMAETLLKYGKDPELRAMAEEIVQAQKSEIAQLEAWLKAWSPEGEAPEPSPEQHQHQ